MGRMNQLALQSDETGTLELVCERAHGDQPEPSVRSFVGEDEFGVLVDGLDPHESVTLYYSVDEDTDPSAGGGNGRNSM